MGRRRQQVPALIACVAASSALVAYAHTACVTKSCTLLACEEGFDVKLRQPLTAPGAYRVVVIADGVTRTCSVDLPKANAMHAPCDGTDVYLTFDAEAVDGASAIALVGLHEQRKDVQSMSIEVSKDGAVVAKSTFAPSYVTRPGPNGAGCDPETCTYGSADFP